MIEVAQIEIIPCSKIIILSVLIFCVLQIEAIFETEGKMRFPEGHKSHSKADSTSVGRVERSADHDAGLDGTKYDILSGFQEKAESYGLTTSNTY